MFHKKDKALGQFSARYWENQGKVIARQVTLGSDVGQGWPRQIIHPQRQDGAALDRWSQLRLRQCWESRVTLDVPQAESWPETQAKETY